MREINECTAEVFRRSEMRIKERRKKNKRILAFCIPLCFVTVLWAAMSFYPVGTEADSFDATANDQVMVDQDIDNTGAVEYRFSELSIKKSPDEIEKITIAEDVAKIFEIIDECFSETEETDALIPDTLPDDDLIWNHPCSGEDEITLTFYETDAGECVYIFSGNRLVSVDTGETVFVSEDRLTELEAVLGLTN